MCHKILQHYEVLWSPFDCNGHETDVVTYVVTLENNVAMDIVAQR